ncbi:unnamed protein product [Moneuplotes crassus]|uniref:Uncharacterized protein n=1 Tax=Euplotes crassus TaxID=5936 RepID=A0AAD1XVX5_EUPCR|nr:unnamed protein product [Moneuplotes crassus]
MVGFQYSSTLLSTFFLIFLIMAPHLAFHWSSSCFSCSSFSFVLGLIQYLFQSFEIDSIISDNSLFLLNSIIDWYSLIVILCSLVNFSFTNKVCSESVDTFLLLLFGALMIAFCISPSTSSSLKFWSKLSLLRSK